MAFFGMYGNRYLGGTPYLFHGGAFGGAHPSSIQSANFNYFTGKPVNPEGNPSLINKDGYTPQTDAAKIQNLQMILKSAKDEQGIVGSLWDTIKGATGLGLSSRKCENYISKVQNGQMTYEEAFNKVSKFGLKQKSAVNMISSITSGTLGVMAIGLCVPTGGLSVGAFASAIGVGAAAKAGIKTLDRATNNVQNDALDLKQIAKDGLSGALNGAVSVGTMGIGAKGLHAAETAKEAVKQGIIAGAKGGAVAGAIQSAGDYTIDCAVEKDQKFEADDLVMNTAYGALAGGVTGAIIGGISGHHQFKKSKTSDVTGIKDDTPPTEPPKGDSGEPKVQKPIEQPVQPVEQPTEPPIGKPVEPPVQQPVQQPVEPLIGKPVEQPILAENPLNPPLGSNNPKVVQDVNTPPLLQGDGDGVIHLGPDDVEILPKYTREDLMRDYFGRNQYGLNQNQQIIDVDYRIINPETQASVSEVIPLNQGQTQLLGLPAIGESTVTYSPHVRTTEDILRARPDIAQKIAEASKGQGSGPVIELPTSLDTAPSSVNPVVSQVDTPPKANILPKPNSRKDNIISNVTRLYTGGKGVTSSQSAALKDNFTRTVAEQRQSKGAMETMFGLK